MEIFIAGVVIWIFSMIVVTVVHSRAEARRLASFTDSKIPEMTSESYDQVVQATAPVLVWCYQGKYIDGMICNGYIARHQVLEKVAANAAGSLVVVKVNPYTQDTLTRLLRPRIDGSLYHIGDMLIVFKDGKVIARLECFSFSVAEVDFFLRKALNGDLTERSTDWLLGTQE